MFPKKYKSLLTFCFNNKDFIKFADAALLSLTLTATQGGTENQPTAPPSGHEAFLQVKQPTVMIQTADMLSSTICTVVCLT